MLNNRVFKGMGNGISRRVNCVFSSVFGVELNKLNKHDLGVYF